MCLIKFSTQLECVNHYNADLPWRSWLYVNYTALF